MRLTEKDDLGNWCLKGVRWEQLRAGQVITKEVGERLYGALCKLKDYEDTGCNPDDVERLNDFTQSGAAKAECRRDEAQVPSDDTTCKLKGENVNENGNYRRSWSNLRNGNVYIWDPVQRKQGDHIRTGH